MQMVMNSLERARRFGKKLGPYVVLEILLPGGTLLALLLFLHQRGRLNIWGHRVDLPHPLRVG